MAWVTNASAQIEPWLAGACTYVAEGVDGLTLTTLRRPTPNIAATSEAASHYTRRDLIGFGRCRK